MWPFSSRKRRGDSPYESLIRSLVDTPHEWTPFEPPGVFTGGNGLRHVSRVEILWGRHDEISFVALRAGGQIITIAYDYIDLLREAIRHHMIARVVKRPRPFTDAAYALAKAIEAGDVSAAVGAADEINEHFNKSDTKTYQGERTP